MFGSSLGKKYWMAITGIFLMLFVIAHLLGNLQIFLGAEWMNAYAEHLEELPILLWGARLVLGVSLLVHMVTGIWLAIENRRARPARYAVYNTVRATVASRTMVPLGLSVFCFIIFHLMHFTFGSVDPTIAELVDAKGRHDVYSMVILGFQNKTIASVYLLAMFFLAAHLRHGVYSFLQTLGLLKEPCVRGAKRFALIFSILIFAGYVSIVAASLGGWLQPLQHAVSAAERGGLHGA